MSSKGKKPATKSAIEQVVSREYTIHLHKRVRPTTRQRRAHLFARFETRRIE